MSEPAAFVARNETELAEIRALAAELDEGNRATLELIRDARDRPESPPPLLAFVHIPKTAGGTASSMLTAAYSKPAMHPAGNYFRGPEKTERKVTRRPGGWETWHRRGGRVTVGHVPYGLFRRHLPEDTRYMTFLREPVDRVISHYYRHVHHPEMTSAQREARREQGKEATESLHEAMVERRLPQLRNAATRLLCGQADPAGDMDLDDLESAKANLREFAFVGIQERFGESIVLLQRTLGLGAVPYLNRHVSKDEGRPAVDEIPEADRDLIMECNQLDAELYDHGFELFERAVAAADDDLAAEGEALIALSEESNEEARRLALEWLNREFPVGASRPLGAMRQAAKADGMRLPALNLVLQDLPTSVRTDDDGNKILTRTDGTTETT